jgi:hypothetical protein
MSAVDFSFSKPPPALLVSLGITLAYGITSTTAQIAAAAVKVVTNALGAAQTALGPAVASGGWFVPGMTAPPAIAPPSSYGAPGSGGVTDAMALAGLAKPRYPASSPTPPKPPPPQPAKPRYPASCPARARHRPRRSLTTPARPSW